jgi:Rod binding domain-containing protein
MDIGKLMLTELSSLRSLSDGPGAALSVSESSGLSAAEIEGLSDREAEQVAKDFESVFIGKLFDQVKDTVGGWGSEEDGASEQVQGLFWLCLARDVADKGGFGLWRDIYKLLRDTQRANVTTESMDRSI